MIRHHPDEALLLEYARGGVEPAISLIVATHLALCPACRRVASLGEAVGGGLLAETAPASLSPGALDRALARLDAPQAAAVTTRDGTPLPLRAYLGRDLSQLRWRRMGPSLAYVPLARRKGTALRLLRAAPGADAGRHSHRGLEYTLVLKGGYTDETGQYGPGDFQCAASDIHHNPVADPGEDCVNLAVTTAPLRFDGLVQTLAGKLFGF
jgi:putative transcriptional regulator